jgi:EpsI family protein
VLLGLSLLLHVSSLYARVMFPSGFALIGVLAALLLLWGGRPLLRAYWLPVAFLAFMVPLPMDWIFKLNFQLKFFAGNSALWLTNHVFHVPAIMDGATIIFEPAADGTPKELVVESVCGGLRSLISLICFAALFAVVCRAKGAWRLVILGLSVPIAIACNIVRITALNLVADRVGVDAAGPSSVFHNFTGLLLFIVALALLFGVEQLILLAGRLLHRDWSDNRLLGFLDPLTRGGGGAPPATLRPAVLLALALSAGLSVWWANQAVAQNSSGVARHAVPASITINGEAFASVDETLDAQTLAILETNDYVYRRFYNTATRREADLLIVFSPDNRKGTHPPDVCLEGGGEEIVHKADCPVEVAGRGRVVLRELVSAKDNRQMFHLYVYKCGDDYTNSYWMQQLKILVNGLTSRNAAGALIRFTVPIRGGGVEAARDLAVKAASELLPSIDKGLP